MGDDDPWGTSDDPEEAARAAKELAEIEAEQKRLAEEALAAGGGEGGAEGAEAVSSGPRLPKVIPPPEDPRRPTLRYHWVR